MRELTKHKVNGLNEALTIEVLDEPGQGGANHEYLIRAAEPYDESDVEKAAQLARCNCRIHFQNGPIKEVGVTGISEMALLAIVEDRLKGFQSGEYATQENKQALFRVKDAIGYLRKRTQDRMDRGVEGTHEI